MSDVIIFVVGCFVSLVVAGAVGLLMWGAAHEPDGGLLPSLQPTDKKNEARSALTEDQPNSSSLVPKSPA